MNIDQEIEYLKKKVDKQNKDFETGISPAGRFCKIMKNQIKNEQIKSDIQQSEQEEGKEEFRPEIEKIEFVFQSIINLKNK